MNANKLNKRKKVLYHGFTKGKVYRVKRDFSQTMRRIFKREGLKFECRTNLEEGC